MRNTLACLLLSLLCSCAANIGTIPRPVLVDSSPRGAEVVYQGLTHGFTPCTFAPKHDDSRFTLKLDGHHTRQVDLGREGNVGLVLGGILLLGPLEIISAALTNAFSRTRDTPVSITLAPSDAEPLETWVVSPPTRTRVKNRQRRNQRINGRWMNRSK